MFQAGNTPLIEYAGPATLYNGSTVLIKDESANRASHTHKDRRSALILEKAFQNKADTLALVTTGDAGYSLAKMAQDIGLRIVTIVGQQCPKRTKDTLEDAGAEVRVADLSEKMTSAHIERLARKMKCEKIMNVTTGFQEAYIAIVDEIAAEQPDVIVVPIGSGELFQGIAKGIRKHNLHTELVGVAVQSKRSAANKLSTPEYIKQTPIWHAKPGHSIHFLSEHDVQTGKFNCPKELDAEISAQAVFERIGHYEDSQKKFIVVNAGKGLQ